MVRPAHRLLESISCLHVHSSRTFGCRYLHVLRGISSVPKDSPKLQPYQLLLSNLQLEPPSLYYGNRPLSDPITQFRQLHIVTSLKQNAHEPTRIQFVPQYQNGTLRSFSSSQRQKKGPNNNNSSSSSNNNNNNRSKAALANEELIARLIRDANGASSDTISVRLVIDEGPNEPSTVQVTSLTDAVKISLERNADLIVASLDNSPPVIRVAELSKLQYKAEQAQKKQQQQSSSNKKEKKSFRFKAGIDSHDLERKVAQLTGYLKKGNDCEYTVFSRARTLRENQDAGTELVDKIQGLIADYGVLKRAPETNETKSFYRVQLQPKK